MMITIGEVDVVVKHFPIPCKHCHSHHVQEQLLESPLRHEVSDLPPVRVIVTEHQAHHGTFLSCGKISSGKIPPTVSSSAFGSHLQAEIAMLTGRYRLSRGEVVDYVGQAWNHTMGVGNISNIESTISHAMIQPYAEALTSVQNAPIRHVDETGWREGNRLS